MGDPEDLLSLKSARLVQISFEPFPLLDDKASKLDPNYPGHQFVFSETARTKRTITYRITDTLFISGLFKATITYSAHFRMSRDITKDEMENREMASCVVESIMPFTSAIVSNLSSYSFDEPLIVAPFISNKDNMIFHKDS